MHDEVKKFIGNVKASHKDFFENSDVCELGSLNINGSPREFFINCKYIGVDYRVGPDVDYVGLTHELSSEKKYDVVISCEMLEHDKYYEQSIKKMVELLKPGGLLIITCAAPGRAPHEQECGIDNYYANIKQEDLIRNLDNKKFKTMVTRSNLKDIYFYGIKND